MIVKKIRFFVKYFLGIHPSYLSSIIYQYWVWVWNLGGLEIRDCLTVQQSILTVLWNATLEHRSWFVFNVDLADIRRIIDADSGVQANVSLWLSTKTLIFLHIMGEISIQAIPAILWAIWEATLSLILNVRKLNKSRGIRSTHQN